MTKAKRRRLSLIHALCELSKEGWRNARYEDYSSLEAELRPFRRDVMAKFSIEFVKADSFGVVPGSGWVIKENGKRLDWPMLATRAEAVAEVVGFQRKFRQLASDEASERRGLSRMNGEG